MTLVEPKVARVLAKYNLSLCDVFVPFARLQNRIAGQRLPKRLPYNKAMEMLLIGERLSAQEAASYGLINKVVPADQLMDAAMEWANKLAETAPLGNHHLAALVAVVVRGDRFALDVAHLFLGPFEILLKLYMEFPQSVDPVELALFDLI